MNIQDAATHSIATIGAITDVDELKAYWMGINKMQPHMAKRPDVIAANAGRMAAITGKESK